MSTARPARLFSGPQAATLLLTAAVAWAAVAAWAAGMDGMTGTMGLGLGGFVAMWALMMAAMMLPSVSPLASLYVRTFRARVWRRTVLFVAGYLLVWAATGLPVYVLTRLAEQTVEVGTGWSRALAAGIFLVAGAWQLTPLKDVCLRHCRSPLGLLLHYGSYRGRLVDLRVGMHHGMYCLGCCWALMTLFVVFGVMNLWAMLGLAALVLAEKRWGRGQALAQVAGVALLVVAVMVLLVPGLAPALVGGDGSGDSPMSDMGSGDGAPGGMR